MPPQVERRVVSMDTLARATYNPRRIDKAERAGLAASLDRFGLVQEIVVNRRADGELRVVGGHQRLDILQAQGTKKVPVAIVELDDTDEKALNLALNSHAISGDWDGGKLAEMLEEIERGLPQLFADVRLNELWDFAEKAGAPGDNKDKPEPQVEKPRVTPVTRLGDVWLCGPHRIICGDSAEPDVLARLMQGAHARLLLTDPPYNLAGEASNVGAKIARGGSLKYGRMGKMRSAQDLADAEWDVDFKPHKLLDRLDELVGPDATAYVFTSHFIFGEWVSGLRARKWDHVNFTSWCKTTPTPSMTKRHWTWAMELCVYATRGKHVANFPAEGHALSWWESAAKGTTTEHPTEKPVDIVSKALRFSSEPGDLVVDPFGGSGTLLVACEREARIARLCELNPVWVDAQVARWQAESGQAATLEGDGRTFAALESERRRAA